jgi:hypothetical protein
LRGYEKAPRSMLKKGLNGSLDNAKVDLVTVRQVATKKAKQEAKDAASAVEALGILQVLALLFLILRKSYS